MFSFQKQVNAADLYLPLSSGATSSSSAESVVTKNLGTISNRGMEVSADVDVFKSGDWKINVGANLTLLKNEIVKLPEQNKNGIIDGTKYIVEGKSRYEFYMYTYEGIDSNNGYTLYKFNDGDAQGNSYRFELGGKQYGDWSKDTEGNYNATLIKESAVESDIVIIGDTPYSYTTTYAKKEFHGSAIPKVYGSFNLNATWKQLTLDSKEDEMFLCGEIPDRQWVITAMKNYLHKVFTINPSADFNRAPVTKIEGMPMDTMLTYLDI